MLETFMKVFLATKMKCAVVSALISIAFVSQAFAVLRPLFPAKPAPPFNGELIIIEDDSVMGVCKKTPARWTQSGNVASRQTQRYGSVTGLSLLWQRCRNTQLFTGAHNETL